MKKKRRKLWSIVLVFALLLTSISLPTSPRTASAADNDTFTLYFYYETENTLYMDIWNHAGIEFAENATTSNEWSWTHPQGILKPVDGNDNWYSIPITILGTDADGFDIYNGGDTNDDKVATYDNQWNNAEDYATLTNGSQSAYAIKDSRLYTDLSEAGLTLAEPTPAPEATAEELLKQLTELLNMVPENYTTWGLTGDSVTALTTAIAKANELIQASSENTSDLKDAYTALNTAINNLVFSSELYAPKIDGMDDDFIRGMDISSVYSEYQSGVKYYDFDGEELFLEPTASQKGFFDFIKECGVNWVRIRVWNDPYDAEHNGYGGGNNDLAVAKILGAAASKAGLKVLIDFHYSDFWADPNMQDAPKDWKDYTLAQKETAVTEFTKDSLTELLNAGVDVGMVQIGNETNNGLCGETAKANVCTIMKAGISAVHEIEETKSIEILTAIHYTDIHVDGNFDSIAETLDNNGVDYDVFAASYYPFWHGTTSNLTTVMKKIATTYNKKVMVAETSYAYTLEDGDGHGNNVYENASGMDFNYSSSVQGQANAVADVMNAVCKMGDAGIGMFYWEPAWIPVKSIREVIYDDDGNYSGVGELKADSDQIIASNKLLWEENGSGWASSYSKEYDPGNAGIWYGGSSWDNQAMFDFDGKPLESINIYKYVFTGTTATVKLETINDISLSVISGEDWTMPETVSATYTDNSAKQVSVSWTTSEVNEAKAAGVGTYTIHGTVSAEGKTFPIVCKLEIKQPNLLSNPGFEDENMSMWDIKITSGDAENIGRISDGNERSGEYALKFWDEGTVDFTAEQTVILDKGIYELSAYVQGAESDNGTDAVYKLYAIIDGQEYTTAQATTVTTWQNWSNPTISSLKVTQDNTTVTIGVVTTTAADGGWGAWDDFYLRKTDDLPESGSGSPSPTPSGTPTSQSPSPTPFGNPTTQSPSPSPSGNPTIPPSSTQTTQPNNTQTTQPGGSTAQKIIITGTTSYTKTYGAKAFTLDAKASSGTLTFTSSDKTVATVNAAGVVTIKKTGAAVITASAGTTTMKITIKVKPKKVTGVKTKAGKKKITVRWTAAAKAAKVTGYQIQYSTKKNFKKATTVTSKTKTVKLKKLKSKKTYYVRIRAYTKNGSSKIVGAYSASKKVKVK